MTRVPDVVLSEEFSREVRRALRRRPPVMLLSLDAFISTARTDIDAFKTRVGAAEVTAYQCGDMVMLRAGESTLGEF